ncbi:uncharacterized protein LOC131689545 [Topomyia yanbarensis]|uniref:uncharacterized protein LOC131689545 n=1 Tax=Topomyia yanbarensis TaxID=2498891 RepID=UPI00273CCC83|nr:uncharacterized protein LOC131689545 [Topomyia yanbarensis]
MRYFILMVCFVFAVSGSSFSGARRRLRSDVVYNERSPKQGYYKYGYAVKQGESQFHHQRSQDGAMYGCYGYVDPSGKLFITHYLADMAGYRLVNMVNPDRKLIERLRNIGTANNPIELQSLFPQECSADGDIKMLQQSADQMKQSSTIDYDPNDLQSRSFHASRVTVNENSVRHPPSFVVRSNVRNKPIDYEFEVATLHKDFQNSANLKNVMSTELSKVAIGDQSESVNVVAETEARSKTPLQESLSDHISTVGALSGESVENTEQSRVNAVHYNVEQQDEIDRITTAKTDHFKTNDGAEQFSDNNDAIEKEDIISTDFTENDAVATARSDIIVSGESKEIDSKLLERTSILYMDPEAVMSTTTESVGIRNTESVVRSNDGDLVTRDHSIENDIDILDRIKNDVQPAADLVEDGNTAIYSDRVELTKEDMRLLGSSDNDDVTNDFGSVSTNLMTTEASFNDAVQPLESTLDDIRDGVDFNFDHGVNTIRETELTSDAATSVDYSTDNCLLENNDERASTPGFEYTPEVEETSKFTQEEHLERTLDNKSHLDQNTTTDDFINLSAIFLHNTVQGSANYTVPSTNEPIINTDYSLDVNTLTEPVVKFEHSTVTPERSLEMNNENMEQSFSILNTDNAENPSVPASNDAVTNLNVNIPKNISPFVLQSSRRRNTSRVTINENISKLSKVFRGSVKYVNTTSSTTKKAGPFRTISRNRSRHNDPNAARAQPKLASSRTFAGNLEVGKFINNSTVDSAIDHNLFLRHEHSLNSTISSDATGLSSPDNNVNSLLIEQPSLEYSFSTRTRSAPRPHADSKINSVTNFGSSFKQPSSDEIVLRDQSELNVPSAEVKIRDPNRSLLRYVLPGVGQNPAQVHRKFAELGQTNTITEKHREVPSSTVSQSRIGPLPGFGLSIDDIDPDQASVEIQEDLHRLVVPKLPATPKTTIGDLQNGITLPYALLSGTDKTVVTPRPTTNFRPFTTPILQAATPNPTVRSRTTIGPGGDIYDEIEEELHPIASGLLPKPISQPASPTSTTTTAPIPASSTSTTEPYSYCYEIVLMVPSDAAKVIIKTDSVSFRVFGQGDPDKRIKLMEPGVYEVNVGATSAIKFQQYQGRTGTGSQSNKVRLDIDRNFDYGNLVQKPLFDRRSYEQQQAAARAVQTGNNNPYLPLMGTVMPTTEAPVQGRSAENGEADELQVLTADQRALLSLVPSWKKVLLRL